MQCVSTTSMVILINRSPSTPFKMQRGLRQGEPLSPFLFILIGEVFNRMVVKAKTLNLVEGIRIDNDAIELSHIQFTDDTLVICLKSKSSLLNFRRLMDIFSVMFGFHINYNKSVLIPFRCDKDWVEEMKLVLRCTLDNLPIGYLGIPLGANPKKISTWEPIIEKVQARIAMWKAKFLSRVGRLVLIKFILNNLPLYYLSLFKMPKSMTRKIISVQRSFF